MRQFIAFGLFALGLVACGDPKKNDAPTLGTKTGSGNSVPKPTSPTTSSVPAQTGIVQANLSGYPADKSGEATYSISVTGAKEYKWKYGESDVSCSSPGGYTAYQSSSNPIRLDLSDNSKNAMTVKVCVVGRSDSEEQKIPTEVTWNWIPAIPGPIPDQMEMIDGDNQVKITPKTISGNWLVIRSRNSTLSARPEDGKIYNVNDALGGGTVVGVGAAAEITDSSVKNLETWNYTFFAYSPARRYSAAFIKPMTLSEPKVMFVDKNGVKPGHSTISAQNNGLFLCRVDHFVNGSAVGKQLGRTSMANNIPNSLCRFEYAGTAVSSVNFEVLVVTKGDPNKLVGWSRAALNSIPAGTIIGGYDGASEASSPQLYYCRGYNGDPNAGAQLNGTVGKFGTHLSDCRSVVISGNTPVPAGTTQNFEVLVKK